MWDLSSWHCVQYILMSFVISRVGAKQLNIFQTLVFIDIIPHWCSVVPLVFAQGNNTQRKGLARDEHQVISSCWGGAASDPDGGGWVGLVAFGLFLQDNDTYMAPGTGTQQGHLSATRPRAWASRFRILWTQCSISSDGGRVPSILRSSKSGPNFVVVVLVFFFWGGGFQVFLCSSKSGLINFSGGGSSSGQQWRQRRHRDSNKPLCWPL